jgi:hypothetical protein
MSWKREITSDRQVVSGTPRYRERDMNRDSGGFALGDRTSWVATCSKNERELPI